MYTQIEKRLELAELLLQVLENPAENRVIVKTHIPDINQPWENNEDNEIYYMIDKSDGYIESERNEAGEVVKVKDAEIYDNWHVSDSAGSGAEFPTYNHVLDFFCRLAAATRIEAYVESF